MSDTEKLKPCPFCGRQAKVTSWWSEQEECGVACVACSKESYFNGHECAVIYTMRIDEKTARKDAIAAWNRRTS